MFVPSLAEVLKLPQNSLVLANSCNSASFEDGSSRRSTLFSTKRQGNFPPSKNTAASSTEVFHLIVLYYIINYLITYSSLVWTFVASDITTHPWASFANILVTIAFLS